MDKENKNTPGEGFRWLEFNEFTQEGDELAWPGSIFDEPHWRPVGTPGLKAGLYKYPVRRSLEMDWSEELPESILAAGFRLIYHARGELLEGRRFAELHQPGAREIYLIRMGRFVEDLLAKPPQTATATKEG
jgi:hypothetical protein